VHHETGNARHGRLWFQHRLGFGLGVTLFVFPDTLHRLEEVFRRPLHLESLGLVISVKGFAVINQTLEISAGEPLLELYLPHCLGVVNIL